MIETVHTGRAPGVQVAEATDRASARLLPLFDGGNPDLLLPARDNEVAAAYGLIGGVPAAAYATDPARRGGAMTQEGCARVAEVIERADLKGLPVVGVWQSGGASLGEGVGALDGVGRVFRAIVGASGRIPQISVVLGSAAGGAAYGSALTDLVIMAEEASMFVTGPRVVRDATGVEVGFTELGGAAVHSRHSGVAHLIRRDEGDCLATARDLVRLLGGQGGFGEPGDVLDGTDLRALLPESPRQAYPVTKLVDALLDAPAVQLHPRWAPNVVTALGRLGGRTVGVVANNPLKLGGCLDADAGDKASRFVRMCDAYGVPLVVLVDVPGYLPGVSQETSGVLRRGAKLLHAFAACQVPRVTLITRKAFGGAFIAMNSRSLGADAVYAWPGAEVDVMGVESTVRVAHRRRLEAVADPAARAALEAELVEEYRRTEHGLAAAVRDRIVDAVIDPVDTRSTLIRALSHRRSVPHRLPNIPL
ncbi:carboxyl transferase domain-containing protein [Catellatospora sp. NPDC049609]|uniref:carboxyl transferase domain-containing protein n=1 Tax=Catellatospora sp. NPDC049609 TaxID=3155505 RepID=UPI00341EF871